MTDNVFKGIEIVGTSEQSFTHAIEVAVKRARQTLHNLSWFVVTEQRGGLQQGRLEYQVTLKVYFKLDRAEDADTAGEGGADRSAPSTGQTP
ncbi:MAG TPA: dodecin [Pyrinomonadaceae bacterium]|nr:dodecin [Pyrinomonadaceae bacterium]